jgi:hypothetical protein
MFESESGRGDRSISAPAPGWSGDDDQRIYGANGEAAADDDFLLYAIAFGTGILWGAVTWFLTLKAKDERDFF